MYQQNNQQPVPNQFMPQQQPIQPTMPNQGYGQPMQQPVVPQVDWNQILNTDGAVTESGAVLDKQSGMPKQGINQSGPWMLWKIKLQTSEGTKTMKTFRKADPQGQWLPVPMTGNYIKAAYKCEENSQYPGDVKRAYKTLIKWEHLNNIQTGMAPNTQTPPPQNSINSPMPVFTPQVDTDKIRQTVNNYVQHCREKQRNLNQYELIGVYFNNHLADDPNVQEIKKVYGEVCGTGQ